ncbi:hypothetical protein KIK06_08825 [Nocardiopsis sp. EMB25]|uniref:hypothetical protein n=1 Tax=Nocardiopsis TaxID=2013 RepID=UPI000349DC57|nr:MULTISPECIES: hypothetical protein [Nocardiopsis]MCY9783994.1 hypothetical protein [Nocardiopsis sp. EMB25]
MRSIIALMHAVLLPREGRDDGGYSTETVVVIAVLVLMASAAVWSIYEVVTAKADSLTLD